MKLFLPSARATNWLLIVGFCSIGYALYMRYLAVEQSTVGLACQAGLNTWLCFTRQITIALFTYSAFGWARIDHGKSDATWMAQLDPQACGTLYLDIRRMV